MGRTRTTGVDVGADVWAFCGRGVDVAGRGVAVGGCAIAVWNAGGGATVAVAGTDVGGTSVAVAGTGVGGKAVGVAVAGTDVAAIVSITMVGAPAMAVWNAGGGSRTPPDASPPFTEPISVDVASSATVTEGTDVAIAGIRNIRGVAVGPGTELGKPFSVWRLSTLGVGETTLNDIDVAVATEKVIAVGAAISVPTGVGWSGNVSASAGNTKRPSTAPTEPTIAAAQTTGTKKTGRRRFWRGRWSGITRTLLRKSMNSGAQSLSRV